MVTVNTFRPAAAPDPASQAAPTCVIEGQKYTLVHNGRTFHIWHTIDPDLGESWLVCFGPHLPREERDGITNRTLAVYHGREELATAVSGLILQDEVLIESELKYETISTAIDKGFAWLANLARAAIAIAVGLALFALITGCSTYTHPCDCQPDAHFQADDGHWYYGYRMADKGSRVGRKGYIVHDTLCTNAVHHQEP